MRRWREVKGTSGIQTCVWTLMLAVLLAGCTSTAERVMPRPAPQAPVTLANEPVVVVVAPPATGGDEESLDDAALIAVGDTLYATNCAPCHRVNGEGVLGTVPPLNRNAFVTVSDPTGVIDTVLHGRRIMPAFAVTLSDQEVAAVLSYIRNAWNNQAPVVSVEQVQTVREQE